MSMRDLCNTCERAWVAHVIETRYGQLRLCRGCNADRDRELLIERGARQVAAFQAGLEAVR